MEADRTRRILLITYQTPPMPQLGGDPWGALGKHLARRGHAVTVLTTSAYGSLSDDVESHVVRTADLTSSAWLRHVLRRPPMPAVQPPAGSVQSREVRPPPLTRIVVPDPYALSWVPFAAPHARSLVDERQIDCVITSAPPSSCHLVALALGARRPAWIADFRDGWNFEPLRPPFPTALQRALDRKLERRVVGSADCVTGSTHALVADLVARLDGDAHLIGNAWDPDLETEVDAANPPPLEPDKANIVYTGALRGGRGHEPDGLLDAVKRIARQDPTTSKRLRIVVAGPLTEGERVMIDSPEMGGLIRWVGALPRVEALALQRRADALLLITSHDPGIVTAKVFEYVAAGRPIIALAGANEAARVVRDTCTGVLVSPNDVSGIASVLKAAATSGLAREFEPRNTDRYTYPQEAIRVEEVIKRAIERRAATQPPSALTAAVKSGQC